MKSFLFLLVILVEGCFGYRVVCVYTNWSQYRPPGAKFLPEDVDAKLCTHLIYVYAKLKGNKLEPTEWNDDGSAWSEGMYDRVNNLKQINPEMKTLLGVGGWMMGSKDFSKLASGRISRKLFAKTSVKFLRDRKFDGLAIDWQHPTKRGGKPQDKVNFSLLLKEIRKAFQDDSRKTGLPPLLLTAGVSASREVIEEGYEIDNLTKYTDFLNVMAYDLHGAWDNYTGHPSQLYPREEEFGPPAEINVDSAMRYWMSKVPDRTKLILGVSSYGRTFTLRKTRHNDYNVPTTGPGEAGEFTQQPGMLAYYERCSQYADAKRVWDPVSQVAYWHKGNQWIAGEDVESVKAKVNWTRTYEIGGVMLWSLDTDDFDDMCISELYPLLNAVVTALNDPTFVTRNTSLHDQIMHISSDKNIKSISETKISDNEITPTTTATKIKPTANITPKTKISETVSSKVVDKAANVNSKIMETKVKANIHENSKVQSLDKDNTLQTRNNQPGSKSDHDTLKSTKSKKVKPKGKRRRMSPKMRRMMFLRRRKQQQNRKKQLKGKGKSDKPNESINKNKRSKAKDDSPTINQRSKNVDNPTDKLQTESNISSSIDVPRENESLTVNRKLNVNTEDNKDKKVFSGKSNQESLIVKEEAKITTIMKLAFNDSSVDENILTKDMLKKGKNKTKVTNGSKITIGKTLRIAPRRKARPVINIKQRHMQLKATTNTKSDKPQGEMNPLNKKLKTNKLSDNFNTHETTTNNIRQENTLKSLSNPTVQKNDRQNGRKIKTGKLDEV
ncbi:oviduct-specific glycoprotein-like isoform X2 [Ruditapes philippinarum]|uniref:oviduct-specific glycoprotein-like isoform X2 n=1 Tax=Ruditapes philippinarum TaxID=129788 RepID=UPI00295B1BF7|nr:oviduct-specific glycoprotein-like isoform X2 [Ruditapes philippinarum]